MQNKQLTINVLLLYGKTKCSQAVTLRILITTRMTPFVFSFMALLFFLKYFGLSIYFLYNITFANIQNILLQKLYNGIQKKVK